MRLLITRFVLAPFVFALLPVAFVIICGKIAYATLDITLTNLIDKD